MNTGVHLWFYPLYLSIFRKYVEKIQVSLTSDKNKGTLHEYQCTFMILSAVFEYFSKIYWENSSFINVWQE